MKYTLYLLSIATMLFTHAAWCMEQATPLTKDLISTITLDLDLFSISTLLRTCKTYNDPYSKGLPANTKINPDTVTYDDLQKIQFGINRFLQYNPSVCKNFNMSDHLHTLVHYTQTNNITMFEHVITHENKSNREKRINILEFFDYINPKRTETVLNDLFNLKNNMLAYKAITKGDTCMKTQIFITTAQKCHDNIIKIFLLNGIDINSRNACGTTALHFAKHIPTVQLLLNNNINIHATDRWGNTALHWACHSGNLCFARLLISNGAGVNDQNTEGNTPLHLAFMHNQASVITLLQQNNADPSIENKQGNIPFDAKIETKEDEGAPICAIS